MLTVGCIDKDPAWRRLGSVSDRDLSEFDCCQMIFCFREFRSIVIDIVLATDMSFHFQQIKNMKSHLNSPERYVFHLASCTRVTRVTSHLNHSNHRGAQQPEEVQVND